MMKDKASKSSKDTTAPAKADKAAKKDKASKAAGKTDTKPKTSTHDIDKTKAAKKKDSRRTK